MIDHQMAAKLRANGFTDMEIDKLCRELANPNRKGQTLHIVLIELKRRLYGACLLSIALLFFAGYASATSNNTNGPLYFLGVIIFCIFALAITPLPLAWKSVKFLRKQG